MYPKNCPHCNANFVEEHQHLDVRGEYACDVYYRCIGIDGYYIGVYDGTVAFMCPDCNKDFPVSNAPLYIELYNKYKETKNESNS